MRWIFHVDMDAFYASIEQRDDPTIRGRPVLVGGTQRRGVVAAASYEARKFGVYSAMPMVQALRKCPQAVVVPPNISKYAEDSRKLMGVLHNYSPHVEPLSLDEAFLEMTGTEVLFGPPRDAALAIKRDIFEVTKGLTASVGVAPNKYLAKIASDMDKPDGVTLIPHGQEASYIADLPIRRIWGVGKKTEAELVKHGFRLIRDIAAVEEGRLVRLFGQSFGKRLYNLSRGIDDRAVSSDGKRKSVGSENTLSYDIQGRTAVVRELRDRCETVARELRSKSMLARGIRVKVRFTETFSLQTRQVALPRELDDGVTLWECACELLDTLDLDQPIRLVGASAFDLVEVGAASQLSLFAPASAKSSRLEHTMDEIRAKFGEKIWRGDK